VRVPVGCAHRVGGIPRTEQRRCQALVHVIATEHPGEKKDCQCESCHGVSVVLRGGPVAAIRDHRNAGG